MSTARTANPYATPACQPPLGAVSIGRAMLAVAIGCAIAGISIATLMSLAYDGHLIGTWLGDLLTSIPLPGDKHDPRLPLR